MVKKLTIGTGQIRLLEKLCNASAISGQEGEIRDIVRDAVTTYADELKVDPLGNVLATHKGRSRNRFRVLVAAHMDEVGFMITKDDKDGVFRFDTVGGIDPRQLVGKKVVVGKDHIPGVIGFKPIHLTTASERKSPPSVDRLRIDTGSGGEGKVKPGNQATFAPNFQRIGRGPTRTLLSKAMDDRVGVATLIELLKNPPPNIDLLAAFTTQEEIGLRGARVAAHALNPDLALVLDCSPAYDLPHWEGEENTRYNTRLGVGPALYSVDRGTLSDPRLIRHLQQTAEQENIPYQMRQPGGGSTDAGAIHKSREGIPSISVSVPGRYLHTAGSLIRVSDWSNSINLIYAALQGLTPKLLLTERE